MWQGYYNGIAKSLQRYLKDIAQVLQKVLPRYYKRIGGHVLNVLSGVTMPLHKVDYYDEDAVTGEHQLSWSTGRRVTLASWIRLQTALQ